MIRMIILAVIVIAMWPYIGDGVNDFVNEFNTDAVRNLVEQTVDALAQFFTEVTDKKPWYKRIFS
mgnify:CR=1 FL=1